MIDTINCKLYNLDYSRKFITESTKFLACLSNNEWLLNINSNCTPSRLAILPNGIENIKKKFARDEKDKTKLIEEEIDTSDSELFINHEDFLEEEFLVDNVYGFMWGLKEFKDSEGNIVPNTKRPLIVNLHGGPHVYSTGNFSHTLNLFYKQGYKVLSVNYSGSASFDVEYNEKCCGLIGRLDTAEVMAYLECFKVMGEYDPERVYFMGGSYSGYQGFEFLQRQPGLFQKLFIVNPVVNF